MNTTRPTDSASTCVPHILPLLRFFENPLEKIPHSQSSARASDRKQLSASEENMPGSVASTNNEEYVSVLMQIETTLKETLVQFLSCFLFFILKSV